jgi:hypothetical protein
VPFGVSVNDRGDGGFGPVTSFYKVKKGLYVKNSRDEPFSREIFANLVYGPSYLSLEYALGLSRSDPQGRPRRRGGSGGTSRSRFLISGFSLASIVVESRKI